MAPHLSSPPPIFVRVLIQCLNFYISRISSACLQYLLVNKVMNSYNPWMNTYCQFWVVPTTTGNEAQFYTAIAMYPQFVQSVPEDSAVNVPEVETTAILPEIKPKTEEITESKPSKSEPQEKVEPQKITVQIESNISKHQSPKSSCKKPKRPQTYLTQKAYYMKQKLKGKQKNGIRILRKRQKVPEQQTQKTADVEKNKKKGPEEPKIKRKKLPIMKDSDKQKKVLIKIKQKLNGERGDQMAKIPKLISGAAELNQYCRGKLQYLMCRQINKS